MRAVILTRPGELSLADVAPPNRPSAGEVLVRVRRVGVCGTDLHAYRGRQPLFEYPRIMGHELGVEVLEVGDGVVGLAPGDRCTVEPYLYCGVCVACRSGKTNCCQSLQVLGVHVDGGLREQIVVPARLLHRTETLSFDELVLVETLAVGAHAVSRAGLIDGAGALVIGAGPIGLAVIVALKAHGVSPIVMEVSSERREFCRDSFGIEQVVDPHDGEVAGRLRRLLAGDLPTLAFDATGSIVSMEASFDYLDHGGRLVLVGLAQGRLGFEDPGFHRRELTVMGSRNATAQDMQLCIHRLENGHIDADLWISHRLQLEELPAELPRLTEPQRRVVKAVVEV